MDLIFDKTFAEKLFKAQDKHDRLVSELFNYIIYFVLGMDEEDYKIPFEDVVYDWYDNSFELQECKPDFDMTPEQLQKMWDLGFKKCWFCYGKRGEDGYMEKLYRKG